MPLAPARRIPHPSLRTLAVATAASLLSLTPAAAQEAGPVHHEGLGSLHFPTSGAPEAQADFERGVLLMHSFEYDDAEEAFRAAREADPDFAMAYWGEAMTHNHPIWDEQDREAALAVLAEYAPTPEARAARAPTERERMYLRAVDVLYGPDEIGSKQRRDTLYSRAMEELVEAYPDDFEARAFRALAILGESQGVRDVPGYMRAGALALDLFEENPDHPGAAHYVIHSFDDPTHAPLGLEAAMRYAGVAPDAAHAQHMTTHIFLALGMWDGVVEANERADAVVDRARAARGQEPTDCGHYNQWLAYGYQQQGRMADSEELVMGCLEQAADDPRMAGGAEMMRALHVASSGETERPIAHAELDGSGWDPAMAATALTYQDWTAAFVAALRGDVDEARARLDALEARLDAGAELWDYVAAYEPVWRGTIRAMVTRAEGELDRAIAQANMAADAEAALPVDFGPPVALKPPRELEGEMLLEAGRAEEALSAFRMQLARTPRRARTLDGFAAAAEEAGETALAQSAREELEQVLTRGSSER